jgi:hypothetical protein
MAQGVNDHVHMWRAAVAAVLIAAAVVALAGCGDDDRARIRSMLTAGLTSQDPRVVCEGSLSPSLLVRIYGGTAKCHANEGDPAERISQAQSVEVHRVRVTGGDASAVVVIHGGNHDGARGALSLHRTGDRWLVRDLSVPLLRSQFEAGIRRMQSIDPLMKACVALKMRKLGDARFKALAFGADDAAQAQLAAVAKRCHALIAATHRAAV